MLLDYIQNALFALIGYMTFPTVVLGILWLCALVFKFDFAKNQKLVTNLLRTYGILLIVMAAISLASPSVTPQRTGGEAGDEYTKRIQTKEQVSPGEVKDLTRKPKLTDEERAKQFKEQTDYKSKDQ